MANRRLKWKENQPRYHMFAFVFLSSVVLLQIVWWMYFFFKLIPDDDYDRHVRMLVSEGSFFIIATIFGLRVVYVAMRKQELLRQQYKDFFAGFSHELKTPIAAMVLQLETLQSLELPKAKQDKLISNTLEDLGRLELTIENILDVFRLESGQLNLALMPTEIDAWLHKAIDINLRAYSDRSLKLNLDLNANCNVDIDERYFIAVVANLLQNSVRYSQSVPEITVSTSTQNGRVVIHFADKGVGISPDELEDVFSRYYRGSSNAISVKGSGLGLFLSRQIVEAHDGTIVAERCEDGQGTLFIVNLPEANRHGS